MVDGRSGGSTYGIEPDFAARQALVLAVAWLLISVTIGVLVHARFFFPDLLSGIEILSYGRLRAVFETFVVFGWLTTAGFATLFALLPRLTESQLHNEVLGAAAVLFWSLVLVFGAGTLIGGWAQGRLLAEVPAPIAAGLFVMMLFVLYNAGVTAVRRRVQSLYPTAWYLLAAAFLLPIVYVVGNVPVFSGITDALVQGFYLNGLEMLWLLPIALAIAHYVIPVETGNALYSMRVARVGFWTLVAVG
jgi:cytochrome c oxidase cbb3-type subunit I